MTTRWTLVASATILLISNTLFAQVIFEDDFESYATDAAFEAVWSPDSGDGASPTGGPIGLLIPRVNPPTPPAPFDGSGDPTTMPPVEPLMGQALAFSDGGGVNEWVGPLEVQPSATESIRYQADIFDFVNGNRRFTMGLRNDLVDRDPVVFGIQRGVNFVEIGYYNADAFDPTNPLNLDPATRVNDRPSTGYGYRLALFGSPGGDLVMNPDWQYFALPIEFDDPIIDHNGDGRVGNGDGLVDAVDVGPGWHTFAASITDTGVSFELDLFRDGTVDASESYTIGMNIDPDPAGPMDIAPFTSFRMGGPSGISANEFTMVDNVKLEMVSVGGVSGDFDGNGLWECADIDALVMEIVAGTNNATFDMTGDGAVNRDDITDATDGWLRAAGEVNLGAGKSYLDGDANLDGVVEVPDFNIWNGNKFTTTGAWCQGDFNADGVTDVPDFNIWNGNKFTASDVNSVPEPQAGILATFALIAVWLRRLR